MKKSCITTLGLAALIMFTGCHRMIFENRSECPRFLFFDIANAEQHNSSDRVFVTVYRQPEDVRIKEANTNVKDIQDRSFWFELKQAESWNGYGLLGIDKSHLVNDSDWIIDEGEQGDPLFRFEYFAPGFEEDYTAPVELVKDFARVTVKFLRFDQFESADGQFPFRIVVKGNTCGIDGRTGLPIRGPFMYEPVEEYGGTFNFILPRQADSALEMELWAKPGIYEREGMVDSFSLSALFQRLGSVNWEAKNLPDIYLEIDYVESVYNITVMDWEGQDELIFDI